MTTEIDGHYYTRFNEGFWYSNIYYRSPVKHYAPLTTEQLYEIFKLGEENINLQDYYTKNL